MALETLVQPHLDLFTGPVFEEVCHQFLWRLGLVGRLPFLPPRIGGWWRANEEVDAVAVGSDTALLAECKWTARPIGIDFLRDLERKAHLVAPELEGRWLLFGLCARS